MADISPLFAVDAEHLLRSGYAEEAIALCQRGLEEYPDYPAALSVLAKAYKMIGDVDKAHDVMDDAVKSFSAYKTVKNMQDNIDNADFAVFQLNDDKSDIIILEDDINLNIADKKSFDVDSLVEIQQEQELITNENTEFIKTFSINENDEIRTDVAFDELSIEEIDSTKQNKTEIRMKNSISTNHKIRASIPWLIPGIVEMIPEFKVYRKRKTQKMSMFDIERILKTYRSHPLEMDFSLESIAKKFDSVKSSEMIYDDDFEQYAKPTVVTETIANILLQQGANEEAIEAFYKLAEEHPDRKEYFMNRIASV